MSIAALVSTALLIAISMATSFIPLARGASAPEVDTQSADIDRQFVIGSNLFYISTFNPFLSYQCGSESDYMIQRLAFSSLLAYDEDWNIVGDLAVRWSSSPNGLVWKFVLADNAYFIEPANPQSTAHQVTAEDVKYTFWLSQNYTHRLQKYFPTENGVPLIKSMYSPTPFELTIELSYAFAPFANALTVMPIVPKYYWQPHEDVMGNPTGWLEAMPIGSGPYYYDSTTLPSSGSAVMKRNPIWMQEANKGWQVHVDTLVFTSAGSPEALFADVVQGKVDVAFDLPPSFLSSIPSYPYLSGTGRHTVNTYEFNLNQLTTENRLKYFGQSGGTYNNQLLLDPAVKKAFSMIIDRGQFIQGALEGLGLATTSLVSDTIPWHYEYGSVPGEAAPTFDPAGARQLLMANGWSYDLDGNPATATTYPLCKVGGTDPLKFRFYALSTRELWNVGGQILAAGAAQAGIDITSGFSLKNLNFMSAAWDDADYDVWLWNWMFRPMVDPSLEIMSVLTTQQIGLLSDVFWSNATYDREYDYSIREMDFTARKALVNDLQRKAYEGSGSFPLASQLKLDVVSTLRWTGYSDWGQKPIMSPDLGLPFLYMTVSPAGSSEPSRNLAPVIDSVSTGLQDSVGSAISFTAVATDASVLEYQWYWGDGSKSGWMASPSAVHSYAQDGYYTAYVAARETDSEDRFITWDKTVVTVYSRSNSAPRNLRISYSPANPNDGDTMTFSGSATDAPSDTLYFRWDFGDGLMASGQPVQHRYSQPGVYLVKMHVTDNHVGTDARPSTTSVQVTVLANHPPQITVPDFPGVTWKKAYSFTVFASDPDSRDVLKYTWYWGDGTVSETSSNTMTHTYLQKGTYTLTVYLNDGTGLPRHVSSDSGLVKVVGGK